MRSAGWGGAGLVGALILAWLAFDKPVLGSRSADVRCCCWALLVLIGVQLVHRRAGELLTRIYHGRRRAQYVLRSAPRLRQGTAPSDAATRAST